MPRDGSREDIELLLPWYVNGTLEPLEVAKVEDYLSRNPDMAVQLATLREDMEEAIHANEAIAGPTGAALDRLMARIDIEVPMHRRAMSAGRGLMGAIDDFLRSTSDFEVDTERCERFLITHHPKGWLRRKGAPAAAAQSETAPEARAQTVRR